MKADQIQKLLQKCLSGGTEEDWAELRRLLEKEENTRFREDIFRLGREETSQLKADRNKMWEQICTCQSVGRNRLKVSQKLLRYAAVIAIPILIGIITVSVFRLKNDTELQSLSVASVLPGESKAILKLNNGVQIDLSAVGQDTVFMQGGVAIHVDSSKSIFYQPGTTLNGEVPQHTVVVPRGGEYRLVLADGSVVWLNSDSELEYPVTFTGKQRKVVLKGEAYFDVAKNSEVPFIVSVKNVEVRVLGTQFNINAYQDNDIFQTTLVEGKVKVTDCKSTQSVVLVPDQQAEMENGHLVVRDVDAAVYTAWRQGKFYFESESLDHISAQLERWYDVEFFFTREELKQYEFTGVIRRDYTANQILDIIGKTTNVRFEVKGKTVTVMGDKR